MFQFNYSVFDMFRKSKSSSSGRIVHAVSISFMHPYKQSGRWQDVLDDVPFTLRVGMLFMHDGAPPHFSRIARQYLNYHFPGKWIGRNGPITWPPRSPDLNPIDFYFWGHVKNKDYSTPFTNVNEFWERIVATFNAIRNRPGQLERVRESMMRRINGCVAANSSALWTSYVILKRVPAYERKSISRNLFTFGPKLIGTFLFNPWAPNVIYIWSTYSWCF